ncbi:Replicative DNA helicase [compost metagenome]
MFNSNYLSTGFVDLDRLTHGLLRSTLTVVSSRPSLGKTDFVLSILRYIALCQKKNVYLFSLESKTEYIMQRLLAAQSGIRKDFLREGLLRSEDWAKLEEAIVNLEKANIFINDSHDITVSGINEQIRGHIHEFKPDLIIVDYLELINSDYGQNRYEATTEIIKNLKQLAMELVCPVVVTCQLTRDISRRENKRPILSDLRDSGQIEYNADTVLFLHNEDEMLNPERKNITEVIVAKNRNGPIGAIELVYIKNIGRFANYEKTHENLSKPDQN